MPRRFRRKRGNKRRPTLSRKVARLSRMVRAEKPEVKYTDVFSVTAAIPATGFTSDITSTIAPGTGDYQQRIGDKIRIIGWQLRYNVTGNSATTISSQTIRVIVVVGNGENTVPLTTANVLAITGTTNSYLTAYNFDQRSKFSVKYDSSHVVSAGPAINASFVNNSGHKKFGKLGTVSQYNGATNNIVNHGFYLMAISDTITANYPVLEYWIRLLYTDA